MKKFIVTFFVITNCFLCAQQNILNEDLEYYPLENGNYFEYLSTSWQMPYPPDSSAYSIRILDDTTLENGKYYKVLQVKDIRGGKDIYYDYQRIDSLTGSVYRYKKDDSLTDNEYMIDSLFAQPGDTINCSRGGFSSFGYYRTICVETLLDTLLGFPTEIKVFEDQSFIPGQKYMLAKVLGFYQSSSFEMSVHTTVLVYAEINGNLYGKTITSVYNKVPAIPSGYTLFQNYPNPFNPSTTISYQLPKAGHVTLKVYDVLGREAATLVDEYKQAGSYNSQLSTDSFQLSSGIYFYTLKSGGYSKVKKMLLLK